MKDAKKDKKSNGRNDIAQRIAEHPMNTPSDLAYLRGKGYSDEEILAFWDRDHATGKPPVQHRPIPRICEAFYPRTKAQENTMNENELQDALKNLLEEIAFMDDEDREDAGLGHELADVKRVRTFEEEGVLTTDAGLVITAADGSEYQVTIVKSR